MSDNPLSAWWMNALNSVGNALQPQRPNPLASLIASNPVGTSVVAPQLTNATPIDTRTPVQRQLADAAPLASMLTLGMMAAPSASLDNAAFAKWFGRSKVVDDAGKPLMVYKGMYPYDWTKETATSRGPEIESINRTTPFPTFDPKDPEGVNIAGFFTDNPQVANRFAQPAGGTGEGAVYPVHLSFQNPHVIDAAGEKAGNIQFGPTGQSFRDAIRSGKYDSVIIRNTGDEGNIYIALKPTQVKSAIGNRGTYSARNPSLVK